jgi:glycosyltransferase involved in cell wall biosynthesis
MAQQLTVLIPCKDEVVNIGPCIESVRPIADEILIADSGSTDGTLDVVRQAGGCRVIEREYVHSADFKNWAIPQATHPWVMIVDADERPDALLVREVRQLMAGEPEHDGYEFRARMFFLGHPIRFSGQNTAVKLALFRRDMGRFSTKRVHAECDVTSGNVGRLRGRIDHYSCQCLRRFAATQNRYSSLAALDLYEAGRRVSFAGMFARPVLRFFQFYVVRGGYLDGAAGFLSCGMVALYNFLKYAKLWELHNSRTLAARMDGPPVKPAGETALPLPERNRSITEPRENDQRKSHAA